MNSKPNLNALRGKLIASPALSPTQAFATTHSPSIGHALTAATQGSVDTSKLGWYSRFMLNMHQSKLALGTNKSVAEHQARAIEDLSKELIDAEVTLLREELQLRFSTRFGALAERSVAGFETAMQDVYAIVRASTVEIMRDVQVGIAEFEEMHRTGELSDADFEKLVKREFEDGESRCADMHALRTNKINLIKEAFGQSAGAQHA